MTLAPEDEISPATIGIFLRIAPAALWEIKANPESALDYAYQWAIWISQYLEKKGLDVDTLFDPAPTIQHGLEHVPSEYRPKNLDMLAEFICQSKPLEWLHTQNEDAMIAWLEELHRRFNLLTLDSTEDVTDTPTVSDGSVTVDDVKRVISESKTNGVTADVPASPD